MARACEIAEAALMHLHGAPLAAHSGDRACRFGALPISAGTRPAHGACHASSSSHGNANSSPSSSPSPSGASTSPSSSRSSPSSSSSAGPSSSSSSRLQPGHLSSGWETELNKVCQAHLIAQVLKILCSHWHAAYQVACPKVGLSAGLGTQISNYFP